MSLGVAGYGFRDIGINNRIRLFYQNIENVKVIIINPDNIEYDVSRNLGKSSFKDNEIIFLRRPIQDVNWGEIKKIITRS